MLQSDVKFIGGKESNGIKYDWRKIRKLYAKLHIPPEFYNPCDEPIEQAKYFDIFSMRSIGKTTNVLLLGLCCNALYDTEIIYIRQIEEMILPKATKDLFEIIADPAFEYIKILTDGRYNGVTYKARRWYYCNYDDAGKLLDVAPRHFMFMCSVDKAINLKSGFNAPRGDFLVFDEFINPVYTPDEFVSFCDLVKTIIRDRQSPIIWMLANTIDRESPYYHEMEIYDEVRDMQPGDRIQKTTMDGTAISVTYVSPDIKKKEKLRKINALFFGFQNKKLGSITGQDWSIKPKPHIPRCSEDQYAVIMDNIYVMAHCKYLKLDIIQHDDLGVCCFVHWATRVHEDSIILTCEDITDKRFYFGLGPPRLQAMLTRLIVSNKLYYASNDCAAFLSHYVSGMPKTI